MPICKKCNSSFPNRTVINNKRKNLGGRKYCLDCSPYGLHNTKSLHRLVSPSFTKETLPTEKACESCQKLLPISSFGIHERKDRKTKILNVLKVCKRCDSLRYINRKRKLKQEAVAYKGGECQVCGYSKCLRSLDFHHQDNQSKAFIISSYAGMNLDDIKEELNKCILVCKNCHGEIHEELEISKRK